MLTKKNEHIVTVTNAEELEQLDRKRFRFTATTILRSFNEDFIDETTGETVTVERNEWLYERGRCLSPDDFSALLFHFQAGDLKEVTLSDQQRTGYVFGTSWRLWQAKATGCNTKLNMLLRAPSVIKAYEIVSDYIELNYEGGFAIAGISLFSANVVIERDTQEKPEKPNSSWYIISVLEEEKPVNGFIEDNEEKPEPTDYICYADSVETAKEIIENHIAVSRAKRENYEPYEVKTLSAKTISCNVMIPVDFCIAHKDIEEGGPA